MGFLRRRRVHQYKGMHTACYYPINTYRLYHSDGELYTIDNSVISGTLSLELLCPFFFSFPFFFPGHYD